MGFKVQAGTRYVKDTNSHERRLLAWIELVKIICVYHKIFTKPYKHTHDNVGPILITVRYSLDSFGICCLLRCEPMMILTM